MLTLTVTSFNGKPPAQPASTTFDTSGGTIGRAESNQLVLEDAERTVSRVHAQIVWRDDTYRLIDRGSNPALVNGTPLEPGQEVILRDADQVQIGGYVLRCAVEEADPATWQNLARSTDSPALPGLRATPSDDPFADIFGASTGDPATASNPAGLDDLLRPASGHVDVAAPFGAPDAPPPASSTWDSTIPPRTARSTNCSASDPPPPKHKGAPTRHGRRPSARRRSTTRSPRRTPRRKPTLSRA